MSVALRGVFGIVLVINLIANQHNNFQTSFVKRDELTALGASNSSIIGNLIRVYMQRLLSRLQGSHEKGVGTIGGRVNCPFS